MNRLACVVLVAMVGLGAGAQTFTKHRWSKNAARPQLVEDQTPGGPLILSLASAPLISLPPAEAAPESQKAAPSSASNKASSKAASSGTTKAAAKSEAAKPPKKHAKKHKKKPTKA